MPNITIDHKYLKRELGTYKQTYGQSENFDRDFLIEQERKNDMRYIDVNQCGDNFNARVYMRTENGTTTAIVKIVDYKNHDTTLRHVDSICTLVGERAKQSPGNNADDLTINACKSISDKNGVLKRVSAAKSHIGQFV